MSIRPPQISIIVGLGTTAMAVHSSAMSTTFPMIITQSHLSLGSAQWVLAIYTLVLSSCLITFGSIGDAIGLRSVYLCGLLVVIASSIFLIAAESLRWLLLLRAVEGAGAAMISGTSLGLLADGSAATDYPRSVGWQTGMTYFGLAVGPVLSGVVAAHFHWQAIFVVNIPICAAAFLLAWRLLHRNPSERKCGPGIHQYRGIVPIALIAPLIFLFDGAHGFHVSLRVGVVAATAFIIIILVVVFSNKVGRSALLELPTGSWPFVASEFISYLCTSGAAFIVPIYLIGFRQVDVLIAGCILSCQYIARALAAVLCIPVISRIGVYGTRTLGTTMITLALLTLAAVRHAPGTLTAIVLGLMGTGTGLFVTANSSGLLASTPIALRGTMTGILATARNLGMTVAVLVAGIGYGGNVAATYSDESGFCAAALLLAILAFVNMIASLNGRTGVVLVRATSR